MLKDKIKAPPMLIGAEAPELLPGEAKKQTTPRFRRFPLVSMESHLGPTAGLTEITPHPID